MSTNLCTLHILYKTTRPLFANNCFIFEDLNGFIVSHLHDTQAIDSQVVRTVNIIRAIPVLEEKFGRLDAVADHFLDILRGKTRSTTNILQIGYIPDWAVYYVTITENEFVVLKSAFPSLCSDRLASWLKIFIDETSSYVYGSYYKSYVGINPLLNI